MLCLDASLNASSSVSPQYTYAMHSLKNGLSAKEINMFLNTYVTIISDYDDAITDIDI